MAALLTERKEPVPRVNVDEPVVFGVVLDPLERGVPQVEHIVVCEEQLSCVIEVSVAVTARGDPLVEIRRPHECPIVDEVLGGVDREVEGDLFTGGRSLKAVMKAAVASSLTRLRRSY